MSVSIEYVAGFFDGEGCVGRYDMRNRQSVNTGKVWRQTHLVITNTHRPTLEAIQQVIGGRIVMARRVKEHHAQCFRLVLSSKADVAAALNQMLPYLVTKRAKAEAVVAEIEGSPFLSHPPVSIEADAS